MGGIKSGVVLVGMREGLLLEKEAWIRVGRGNVEGYKGSKPINKTSLGLKREREWSLRCLLLFFYNVQRYR